MSIAIADFLGFRAMAPRNLDGPAQLNLLKYYSEPSEQQVRLDRNTGSLSISGTSRGPGGISTESSLSLNAGGHTLTVRNFVRQNAAPLDTAHALVSMLPHGFSADFSKRSADAVELRIQYNQPTLSEVRAGMKSAQRDIDTATRAVDRWGDQQLFHGVLNKVRTPSPEIRVKLEAATARLDSDLARLEAARARFSRFEAALPYAK